jgi:hypothetical protein
LPAAVASAVFLNREQMIGCPIHRVFCDEWNDDWSARHNAVLSRRTKESETDAQARSSHSSESGHVLPFWVILISSGVSSQRNLAALKAKRLAELVLGQPL